MHFFPPIIPLHKIYSTPVRSLSPYSWDKLSSLKTYSMRRQYLQSRRNPLRYFPFPWPGWCFDLLSVGDSSWDNFQRKKETPCQHVKHTRRIREQKGWLPLLAPGAGQGSVFTGLWSITNAFRDLLMGLSMDFSICMKFALLWIGKGPSTGIWCLRFGKVSAVAQLLYVSHRHGRWVEAKSKLCWSEGVILYLYFVWERWSSRSRRNLKICKLFFCGSLYWFLENYCWHFGTFFKLWWDSLHSSFLLGPIEACLY